MIRQRLRKTMALEFVEAFFYAAALGIVIRFFIITPYKVNDNDMAPTVRYGDYVLSYDLAFGIPNIFGPGKIGMRLPKVGNAVIVRISGNGDFSEAKRVWGLPGDRVEIKKNQLWVNEKLQSWNVGKIESYGPMIVPPNYVFLGTDNANSINAAQGNGLVSASLLEGLIWKIWFSVSWESKEQSYWSAIRWDRIFSSVH